MNDIKKYYELPVLSFYKFKPLYQNIDITKFKKFENKRLLESIIFNNVETQHKLSWFRHPIVLINHKNANWQLGQLVNGPCGVIAALQGLLINQLLKNIGNDEIDLSDMLNNVSEEKVYENLVIVVYDCIVRASKSGNNYKIGLIDTYNLNCDENSLCSQGIFNLSIDSKTVNTTDHINIFEKTDILIKNFSNHSALKEDLELNFLEYFAQPNSPGLLNIVLSVILTKGLDLMNESLAGQGLICQYGHCSQELVALICIGEPLSNTFDYEKVIADDFSLKGLTKRPQIGLLTNSEPTGTFYRHPLSPIWLGCMNFHYSVLFLNRKKDIKCTEAGLREEIGDRIFSRVDTWSEQFVQISSADQLLMYLNELVIEESSKLKIQDLIDYGVIIDDIILKSTFVEFTRNLDSLKPPKIDIDCLTKDSDYTEPPTVLYHISGDTNNLKDFIKNESSVSDLSPTVHHKYVCEKSVLVQKLSSEIEKIFSKENSLFLKISL